MRELHHRRHFLRFLAGSPLLAMPAAGWQAPPNAGIITEPKDALNVIDFEAAARQALPPAHFGFLATGVDDEATLKANREGFNRIQLRPRRLVDVSRADLRTELFGTVWDYPIAIAPVASQKAFHPDGELATARAARSKRTLQILSTVATCRIEEVAEAAGRPIWYQLYPTSRWDVTEKLVRRAEGAGCPVLVLTVDLPVGRNTETLERIKLIDSRKCVSCHAGTPASMFQRQPMFAGITIAGITLTHPQLTWESIGRLKKLTR